ncbi:MAG: copper amine oxidase N-terminal domain-containing protein [Clostridia bacterium]|nr:copper amine oxidase N-terminal domain-containing protein [Clostridia bacterium]
MKRFLCGFLAGALLFSAVGAMAAAYDATAAGFKVFVNGKEFHSDPPAVVIEGRTFLPMRAMGDALGVKVEWNEELRQVEVGDPKAIEPGTVEPEPEVVEPTQPYSRSTPAPIGVAQSITGRFGNGSGTVEIKVLEVIRGKEAQERVEAANSVGVKIPVTDGYEYLLARVSMTATAVTAGDHLMLLENRYAAYSNDVANPAKKAGTITPKPNLQGSDLAMAEIAKGETREGFILLQVKEGDEEPTLVYWFDNDGGIWFKLY